MDELEMNVRNIEKDGLLWKQSQLVAIGFGVRKLRINCVVEDEKVSVDELQAEIEEAEDHVQSTDIVSSSTDRQIVAVLTGVLTGCNAKIVRMILK